MRKLTSIERAVLTEVRDDLIAGRIKKSEFDMAEHFTEVCHTNGHCGTVGCIGGHMGYKLAQALNMQGDEAMKSAYKYVNTHDNLQDPLFALFFEFPAGANPKKAVKAINRVLNQHAYRDPWKTGWYMQYMKGCRPE